jgi:squamous cell carcinoma antigen recognized by T-cells 3
MAESNPRPDIFTQAFGTNLLQTDVEQIVPVILARAGYERRRFEAGVEGKVS